MTRSRSTLLLSFLAAGWALAATAAPASDEPQAASQISYVTGASVYLGTGTDGGLAVGDRVEVVRGEKVIAELEVVEVSASRARCARLGAGPELSPGDEVRKAAEAAPAPRSAGSSDASSAEGAAPPAAAPPPKPRPDRLRSAGLRGRVGVRFLDVRRLDGEGGYRQPSLDLRLDGNQVGGAPIDLNVDVRARRSTRTYQDGSSDSETRNRVYRLSVAYRHGDEPFRVTVGRQFSPSLAVVSLFDGASAEYRKARWAVGLFTGTQPDPVSYAYSSDVREHGAYFEFGGRPGAARRWAITSGILGSYDGGEIDRELVFLQQRFDGPRLSVYATQEMDINRGWKKDAEGESWTVTSAFANLRYRISDRYAVQGGFDDRRNVRLYRDSITPETEFDDRYRRGAWAGFDGKAGAHLSYGVEGRRSDGGTDGAADAYTLRVGAHGLGTRALAVRARGTRYTNERLEGWLLSVSASADLTTWSRIEIHGGTRSESVSYASINEGRLNWYGIDWDAIFGRRFILTLSGEQSQGLSEGTRQIYTTLSYRF